MTKFDVLWYLPRHKGRVLELLKFPALEERTQRGIFGLRWGPGQPPPPGQKGRLGDFSVVWGNFLGYEFDPDLMRKACELVEIEPGLVGGTIKKEFLESERYQERFAEQLASEKQRAAVENQQAGRLLHGAEQEAMNGLLLAVADRMNVRKPEKLPRARLLNLYNLALSTDEFEVPSMEEWKAMTLGEADRNVCPTLETVPDWEAYMGQAFAASSAPTLTIVKKGPTKRIA